MTGAHRMPARGHRPSSAEPQLRPEAPARSWVWQDPHATGRHRLVRPNRVAGLAWPGETTQRLWLRRSGGAS